MNEQDKRYARIMADIMNTSNNYALSYACISGEHEKCKSICECRCHKE